jgi:CBS domain-containing protein
MAEEEGLVSSEMRGRLAKIRQMLEKADSVEDIMTKGVVTIGRDASILDAAKVMEERNISNVVVTDVFAPAKLIGIVTERDLVRKVIIGGLDVRGRSIEEVMSSPLITVEKDADIAEATELMIRKGIRRLPVVEGERLVGIVIVRTF